MSERTLKPGWRSVKFGDVVRLNTERAADPAAAGLERYVGLEHIVPEDLRIRHWGLVADGTTFTNRFRPGQVLFGKRRAYQRKVAVADFDGVCSGDIYIFESKDPSVLLPDLLPFLCQTEGFFEHAVGTSAGSLSPRTNWTQLAQYEFALPPLEEQRQFSIAIQAVEIQCETLTNAKDNARQLRYAIEKGLFEPGACNQEISFGALIEQGKLSLQTGPFGTVLKAASYRSAGHPVINPSDMFDGKIALDNCRYIDDADWARLAAYHISANDMIIGRKGDMSNLVFVTDQHDEYVMGSDCIRFRVHNSEIAPKYMFYFLRAEVTRHWLQSQAFGTTMPGINEKLLARMVISLPLLDDQINAIHAISAVDDAEHILVERVIQAAHVKHALLHRLQDAAGNLAGGRGI